MKLYLDTETTGLVPGNICQLSYLMESEEKVIPKNMFFKVDYMPEEAYKIHGFSVDILKELSGGKTFSDRIDEINADFQSADLIIAHNVSFDLSFLREEFSRAGLDLIIKDAFCTMKKTVPVCKIPRAKGAWYKYPKLNELCAFLGINDKEIILKAKNLFGASCSYHDSRFDTMAVYLATKKLKVNFSETLSVL